MKAQVYIRLSGYVEIEVPDDFDFECPTEDDVESYIDWEKAINALSFEIEEVEPIK